MLQIDKLQPAVFVRNPTGWLTTHHAGAGAIRGRHVQGDGHFYDW